MRHWKVYVAFIAATFLIGYTSALISPPGAWYEALEKPWFNPPNVVFPIAWTLLYILIAVAGAKAWIAGLMGLPFLFWVAQMGLNGLWSYIFFGLHSPFWALIELLVLFATIIGFIVTTWRFARPAALLFLPYAGWVAFAGVLNAAIWSLNS
ncbi:MAG: TspO/MBR family protein [Hyphomicrobiales bacterium]